MNYGERFRYRPAYSYTLSRGENLGDEWFLEADRNLLWHFSRYLFLVIFLWECSDSFRWLPLPFFVLPLNFRWWSRRGSHWRSFILWTYSLELWRRPLHLLLITTVFYFLNRWVVFCLRTGSFLVLGIERDLSIMNWICLDIFCSWDIGEWFQGFCWGRCRLI